MQRRDDPVVLEPRPPEAAIVAQDACRGPVATGGGYQLSYAREIASTIGLAMREPRKIGTTMSCPFHLAVIASACEAEAARAISSKATALSWYLMAIWTRWSANFLLPFSRAAKASARTRVTNSRRGLGSFIAKDHKAFLVAAVLPTRHSVKIFFSGVPARSYLGSIVTQVAG